MIFSFENISIENAFTKCQSFLVFPLFSAFAVNVFQRLKELAAPSNIEITSESVNNNSSQIRNSNDNSSPNTVNKISSDDIR